MKTKKLQKRIDTIRADLEYNLGSSEIDLVNELVELELLLENESNK